MAVLLVSVLFLLLFIMIIIIIIAIDLSPLMFKKKRQ